MKKVLSLSLVALLTLSLVSCSSGIKATTSTSPENYSDLDKEYGQFNTKALTVSYLKKKLDKWKKDNNGKKMLRELEYAKFKHINVLEQVINSQPDSYAYYEGLKSFIEVTSKEGNDAAFKSFIVSLSPDPSSVKSLDASNITTTSFTANWSTVTNASGYMLIVDNGTPIDVGNVTSKNITGLTAGSSHSYVVKSVNEGGTSEASSPVNVTLIPSAPVASDATNISNTAFTANWSSVTGATGYKLFVDGINVYTGASTSCNITALTASSSHSYYVQATNSGGTSVNSNTINLNLNPDAPIAPVANVATDITATSFTANWASSSTATSYKLFIDGVEAYSGTNLSFSKTGLTAGSAHTYYVQGINVTGTSANSNTVNVNIVASAPVASDATNINNTSFTANWASVTGATSYKLFVDGINVYTGASSSCNVTSLTASSSHNYYVQAINSGGTSASSSTINVTLNPDAPTAPVANVATDVTTTSFTANWASSSTATSYKLFIDDVEVYSGANLSFSKTGLTGGSNHSYYVQASNITGTSSNSNTINLSTVATAPVASDATSITNTSFIANWATVTGATSYKLFVDSVEVYSGTNLSFNKTGLTGSSNHSYYVQAINSGGTSANSNTISLTLNPNAPTAPVANVATSVGNTSFTANWGSVTDATSYKLYVDGVNVYTGAITSCNITGLTGNSSHNYYVTASNVTGTSSNSNTVSVLTLTNAPVATAATNVTVNSFTANWATVTGATTYKLYIDGVNVYTGATTNCNATILTAGTTYTYYIKAVNASGESLSSNTISVSTIPSAPVATVATNKTYSSLTANWGAVTGATSYKISVDSGTPFDVGNNTSYIVTGLAGGANHTYYVQAINSGGTSVNSNTITTLVPLTIPIASTATNITGSSFTANWAASTDAVAYDLYVDGTAVSLGNVTSYNVTGLTAGSTHSYYVKAGSAAGRASGASNTVNVTLLSVPTTDLVAYFPFNGNANDASGYTHNGTVSGATLTTDRFGNGSKAYYFSGSPSTINVGAIPEITSGSNWTVSFWMNTDVVENYRNPLDFSYISTGNNQGPRFELSLDGNFSFASGIGGVSGETYAVLRIQNHITVGHWSHVIGMRDGNILRFYIDNVEVGNQTTTLWPPTFTNLVIGHGFTTSEINRWFKGSVDDIRVYKRALTSQEIDTLYHE